MSRMADKVLHLELDREEDGRWIAEVLEVPGALAYGRTSQEASNKALAVALHAITDRLEHDEPVEALSNLVAVSEVRASES